MFKRERSVVRGESEGKEAVQKLPLLYQIHYVINALSVDFLSPGDVGPLLILTASLGHCMRVDCSNTPNGELTPRTGGSRATQHAQPRL